MTRVVALVFSPPVQEKVIGRWLTVAIIEIHEKQSLCLQNFWRISVLGVLPNAFSEDVVQEYAAEEQNDGGNASDDPSGQSLSAARLLRGTNGGLRDGPRCNGYEFRDRKVPVAPWTGNGLSDEGGIPFQGLMTVRTGDIHGLFPFLGLRQGGKR